ncbi:MAG: VOC family protein, partial [Actinomycetota bacterium]|nr:VOC family protein [Actinomycetota bacterium]
MEVLSSRILLHPQDRERATAFYRDVLGLAVHREFPGGTVFVLGGGFLEVSGESAVNPNAATAVWLQVRDLAATAAELVQQGVQVLREPRREPWGLD